MFAPMATRVSVFGSAACSADDRRKLEAERDELARKLSDHISRFQSWRADVAVWDAERRRMEKEEKEAEEKRERRRKEEEERLQKMEEEWRKREEESKRQRDEARQKEEQERKREEEEQARRGGAGAEPEGEGGAEAKGGENGEGSSSGGRREEKVEQMTEKELEATLKRMREGQAPMTYTEYEGRIRAIKQAADGSELAFWDIPWPPDGNCLFLVQGDDAATRKSKYHQALLFWHVDKFVAFCGPRLVPAHRDAVMERVGRLGQVVVAAKALL